MAIGKKRKVELAPAAPHSLIASAAQVRLKNTITRTGRLRDEEWQRETWRFYDEIGEFRYAANYVGSACSRVRIYVADVDELGRIGEETKDDQVQAIAETLFGGRSAKAERLRSIGISLTVAGECYLVGKAAVNGGNLSDSDRWFVLSPSEFRKYDGHLYFYENGERYDLKDGRDIMIRLWTPHPSRPDQADCPARAALPVLFELDRLTRYVFSQLDSRLAGAGILPIPNDIDFPTGDDDVSGGEALSKALTEAAEASLRGEGSAAALVPIIVEMDREAIDKLLEKPITFESVLSEQAPRLREECIRRLATSLDMPPEVLQGASESNHWGIWFVEESAIKIHVEPLVVRIIDALNQAYLRPALRKRGLDPTRYTFWYDTAPLTNRPNRLQDTLNLYERGITSRKEVLIAGGYNPETAAPDQNEETTRYLKELVLREPALFASEPVREAMGIEVEGITMVETGNVSPGGPPPPPAPQRSVEQDTSPTPNMPSQTRPQNQTPQPSLIAASDLVPEPTALQVAANILVTEALSRAGKRLLGNRGLRGQFRDIPPERIHTKVAVKTHEHADQLLDGAWDRVDTYINNLNVDQEKFTEALHNYTSGVMRAAISHDPNALRMILKTQGFE